MPVPGTQEIRRALLEALDREEPRNLSVKDFLMLAARRLNINLEDMSSLERASFKKDIDEAKAYLTTNKLISNPTHNVYMITTAGKAALNSEAVEPQLSEAEVPETMPDATPLEDLQPDESPLPKESQPEEAHDEHEADDPSSTQESQPEELEADDPTSTEEAQPEELEADDPSSTEEPQPEELEADDPTSTQESQPETLEEYEVTESMQPHEEKNISVLSLEEVLAEHNSQLAEKVLARTADLPPNMFEIFVTDLLSKMGYRSFHNARYTSDDKDSAMIQGVILDPQAEAPLYIHAEKRSPDKTIGRADVQDFVNALADKGGKGIFATTALFSENAVSYAQDERILLIDGPKLAGLMISHNFCVHVERTFEVKELDEDCFNDYEA